MLATRAGQRTKIEKLSLQTPALQGSTTCFLGNKRPAENTYFCPAFTKPFKEDPLLVATAFPPRPTMRAVSTALFPPKETK